MADKNREYRRMERILTVLYCISDAVPKKWDQSVIENISAGGIKFIAPSDLDLNNKTVQLKIKIAELAPYTLELDAVVLGVQPRFNGKSSDVRAKFINVSPENKKRLTIVEEIIQKLESKKNPIIPKI